MEKTEKFNIITATQLENIEEELQKNPSLAVGFRRDTLPSNFNEQRVVIAKVVNPLGPPIRLGDGWQRKKMIANKAECSATSGGIFKQFVPLEEAVANLLQLQKQLNPEGAVQGAQPINISNESAETQRSTSLAEVETITIIVPSMEVTVGLSSNKIPPQDNNAKRKNINSSLKKNQNCFGHGELLQKNSTEQAKLLTDVSNSLRSIKRNRRDFDKRIYEAMVKENISVKFLIHLVGERPALWDKTSEDYKDRKLKETSWREICAFVNENFYNLSNRARDDFYKMIMKKWTHIRDSWVKSMKYGYNEVTKLPPKPYVYHNELKFMQKILKCKPHRFDLNQCQPSNTQFEEFFRETNETQNSHGTSQDMGDDEGDDEKQTDIEFKQEPNTSKTESKISEADESDEWNLEETEIVHETEGTEMNKKPLKKKRSSIFVTTRCTEDENLAQKVPTMGVIKQLPRACHVPSNLPAIGNANPYIQNTNYNYNAIDERHWNFFKGILPSVNGLDEDHILQFQSGVISLLQKLRESQRRTQKPQRQSSHSLFKGRGRKRKASLEGDDNEGDWPTFNNNFSRKKSLRQLFDPIAPGQETEYSTDD